MVTLFRLALAMLAAITCCIAAWAGLQALGVQDRPRAVGPVDVSVPAPSPAVPHAPLAPLRVATEASAARTKSREIGTATIVLRDRPTTLSQTLTVRSGWSNAPLATRTVDATTTDASLTLSGLPHGEHIAFLMVTATPGSYLARARIVVPATSAAPTEIDARIASLRVTVRDAAGAPVPRALVRLVRADDPAWIAPTPAPAGFAGPITDATGAVAFAPLGAGAYRVSVIDDDTPPLDVTLPDTAELTFTLAPRR